MSLNLINRPLIADRAAPAVLILEIVQILRDIKHPVVFRGKSGINPTEFIATVYLMVVKAVPAVYEKGQISTFSFGITFAKRNINHYILDSTKPETTMRRLALKTGPKTIMMTRKFKRGSTTNLPQESWHE